MNTSRLPPLGPGTFLRAVRLFRGLSRVELGRRADIHPDRLALIEAAVGRPTFEELDRLWQRLSEVAPALPNPFPEPPTAPRTLGAPPDTSATSRRTARS